MDGYEEDVIMSEEVTVAGTLAASRIEKGEVPYRPLLRVFKLPLVIAIIIFTVAAMLYLSIWEKITHKKIFPGF